MKGKIVMIDGGEASMKEAIELLQERMYQLGLSNNQLSKKTGIARSTLTNYLSMKTPITIEAYHKCWSAMGINYLFISHLENDKTRN